MIFFVQPWPPTCSRRRFPGQPRQATKRTKGTTPRNRSRNPSDDRNQKPPNLAGNLQILEIKGSLVMSPCFTSPNHYIGINGLYIMATIFGDVLYIPKSWDIYQPLEIKGHDHVPKLVAQLELQFLRRTVKCWASVQQHGHKKYVTLYNWLSHSSSQYLTVSHSNLSSQWPCSLVPSLVLQWPLPKHRT